MSSPFIITGNFPEHFRKGKQGIPLVEDLQKMGVSPAHYPQIAAANMQKTMTGNTESPMGKAASIGTQNFSGGGVSGGNRVNMTSPQFYSPIHTPINWQIPTKRREVYLWCVTLNSLVLRENYTYTPIQDIKVGDTVVSHKGNVKKVHALYKRWVDEDIYRIYVNGVRDPIEITGNHEIFASKRNQFICDYQQKRKHQRKCIKINEENSTCSTSTACYERKEVDFSISKIKTKDIEVKDYVYKPIISKTKKDFDIESNDMARFLGFFVAEGCTYVNELKSQWNVNFTFHTKEIFSYVSELQDIIKRLFGKKSYYYIEKGKNTVRLNFQSKEACDLIKKYAPGIAKTKRLHENIIHMPEYWLMIFLGAYLDGDGSYVKKSEIHSITASIDLANQIQSIYNKLGISTSQISKQKTILNGKTFYGYVINAAIGQCAKLTEFCNREIFLGFKHSSKTQSFIHDGNRFNYIKKIEKFHHKGYVYCLGVDDDESFVVNEIAVSNCQFFAQNEPKVAASLRFYSQFPFTGFTHVIDDPVREEHFDNLRKRLRLDHWLHLLAYEYFAMGDVFPFVSFACQACNGIGVTADGQPCTHPGGTIANISILNPNWIDVKVNPLMPENPKITLQPDETLKQIVWSRKPPEIYETIPEYIRNLVISNQPIPLSPRCVSHLKHDEIAYAPYGRSLIAPLFPTLAYQDKLRQAQWIVAERHILPIKLVKVGNEERPAGPADIADVQQQLAATANDPNLTLVTHHAFEFDWIGASGKVLQLNKEYDIIDKNIITGLGVNEALLSGCIPEHSRIMTNNGLKTLDEFDMDNDFVATLNPDNHKFEFQKASYLHVVPYNSLDGDDPPLVHFKNKDKLDNLFTTGHQMYAVPRGRKTYRKMRADEIKDRTKFILKTEGWDGSIPRNVNELTTGIPLKTFLHLAAYFLSEGNYIKESNRKNSDRYSYVCEKTGKIRSGRREIGIKYNQVISSDVYDEMVAVMDEVEEETEFYINYYDYDHESSNDNKQSERIFRLYSVKLAKRFEEEFGESSEFKTIPSWIKNLPSEYLEIFIDSIVKCDGVERHPGHKDGSKKYYEYYTGSEKLCSDICEILLKLKQAPRFSIIDSNIYPLSKKLKNPAQPLFTIGWSPDTHVGNYPEIRQDKSRNNILEKRWKGNVWCVTVPNHIVLFENNGKMIWAGQTGPSYCFDTETRILTHKGFVSCDDFNLESDIVATYNKDKDIIEYQKAFDIYKFDYDSINCDDEKLYHFKTDKIDFLCTYSHRMLVQDGDNDWEIMQAKNVREKMYFKDGLNVGRNIVKNISRVSYSGTVWCVGVPNGFIISERNGLMAIHGNSQAAIGIEATIRRLEIVRNLIGEWIAEYIYKPEAEMQGFFKQDKSGGDIPDYPDIRWDDLNLRDETQKTQMYFQMWDKGMISTQFIFEKLGIDYDVETERVRMEQTYQQQLGIMPQGGGPKGPAGGGGFSGGGGGGGGGGGAPPGGDPNKGNLPGGQKGPGLPGDSIAPNMSGGAPPPFGGPGIGSGASSSNKMQKESQLGDDNPYKPIVSLKNFRQKPILQPTLQPASPEGVEPQDPYYGDRTGAFRLTDIEQRLYKTIGESQIQGNLPQEFLWQQQPEPEKYPHITCDGIFPEIGMIIEADGEQWHTGAEKIAKDQDRDERLRQCGWTVLRFTDDEIKFHIEDVMKTIINNSNSLRQSKQPGRVQ